MCLSLEIFKTAMYFQSLINKNILIKTDHLTFQTNKLYSLYIIVLYNEYCIYKFVSNT